MYRRVFNDNNRFIYTLCVQGGPTLSDLIEMFRRFFLNKEFNLLLFKCKIRAHKNFLSQQFEMDERAKTNLDVIPVSIVSGIVWFAKTPSSRPCGWQLMKSYTSLIIKHFYLSNSANY